MRTESNTIVLHLHSGEAVRIPASDVAYVDEDRDRNGAVAGTCVVLSKVDDAGNPVSHRVKEACSAVAHRLSEIVGDGGIGDD